MAKKNPLKTARQRAKQTIAPITPKPKAAASKRKAAVLNKARNKALRTVAPLKKGK